MLFEKGVDKDLFNQSWKHVSNQSERQLGAFIFLYVSELRKSPALLSQKSVQFRNEVVHKGKIPTRAEALQYGQEVLNLIRPQLQEVKQGYPKGVQAAIFQHLQQSRRDPKEVPATMTISTIISLSRGDASYNGRTLEEAIKELKQRESIV